MLRFFSFVMLTALLFTGCALKTTPLPEPASEGAMVYKSVCGSCHALAHPRRNTYAQWEHLVGVMELRMAQRRRPPMTAEEKVQILEYLKKHSR